MSVPRRSVDPRVPRSLQLSPVQRAYLLDQANFLAGLRHRAERLAADGYTVAPANRPHQFWVVPPQRGEATAYLVDPIALTCTCPFFQRQAQEPLTSHVPPVPCKHLRGLAGLIAHSRDAPW